MSLSIADSGMSIRACRILRDAGIVTVQNLCELTMDDVLEMKGIALGPIREIREFLRVNGLSLKGESVV